MTPKEKLEFIINWDSETAAEIFQMIIDGDSDECIQSILEHLEEIRQSIVNSPN